MRLIANFSVLIFLVICEVIAETDYRERLDLTPLRTSLLHASFQFWSNASLSSYKQQHFRYIPRSLGQILQHSKTVELHLRLTSGRWDDDNWGVRPHSGRSEGGTGVELWAWVEADSEEESFARWTTLNHALSGLFCASLNFIDSTRTTRPRVTFESDSPHTSSTTQNLYLLHGALPREVVCTENLTPFLKLLPCKGNAGIASLLDGHKLFDASWQDNPIPRPVPRDGLLCNETKAYEGDACFPDELRRGQSWTVAEIFGRPIRGSCLAEDNNGAARETLCLHVPDERETHAQASSNETKKINERCYKVSSTDTFEMVLSHLGPQTFLSHPAPVLHASRSIVGHGQERGGVQTLLTNPSITSAIDFVYFESLPWFMKPYLHTLRARLSTSPEHNPNIIKKRVYRPALDRERGTQLELLISVPANSTVFLSYDFDKAILRYTEYPPDANRGFDVAPAVLRLLSGSHKDTYIRTTSLLLPLPTPDFSMPYNVIILTSTVIALAFGSIFNILVRRFVGADEVEGFKIGALKDRLRGRVAFMKARLLGQDTEKKHQ